MEKRKFYLKHMLFGVALLCSTGSVAACEFCHGVVRCEQFAGFPDSVSTSITPLTSSNRTPVFEDVGTIIVYRGMGCAESKLPDTQRAIAVEEYLNLPRYAGNATIFLNGWHLRYLNGKHNVAGLGTSIYNIRLENGPIGQILRWRAGGALSDDNFDDPYSWCYTYTIVAWNPANLALVVDHDDGPCSAKPEDTRDANYFGDALNKETTTALSAFPSFIQNPAFAGSKTVAILPRGFGYLWKYSCNPVDHQMLQVAYNLDHGETFMEKGKTYQKGLGDTTRGDNSIVDQGYVSWETYAIFKDDDGRRDYRFGEIVSGLGGSEVGVVQPPFSILPIEDEGGVFSGCGVISNPVITSDHEIHTVPYKYAIPMLTGWDLRHLCQDEKIQEIGAWITDWSYDPNNPGILRYKLSTALLGDGFYSRHKVTILGLGPVTLREGASPRVKD
jgi:hypothetical protein